MTAPRRILTLVVALAALDGAPTASAQVPPNVPVTDSSLRAYQGPWLAVNPTDPEELAVSFQDGNSLPTCWLGLSFDGGDTWDQVPMVGQDGLVPLPDGHATCLRPSFAYGPDGSMHYAYVAGGFGSNARNTIYLMTSLDDGETFDDPVPIDTAPSPPGNAGDVTPRMATDPVDGRLYVAWQQVKGSPATQDVLVASSDDAGATFSDPLQLNAPTHNAGPPKVAVAPDGRVHVTFSAPPRPSSDPARPLAVHVATSTDEGRSFRPAVTAQEEHNCTLRGANTCPPTADFRFEGRGTNGPAIAAGRSPNEVFLVSYGLESHPGDDLFRVRFSVSRDGGASWGPARTLGVAPGLADHHQIMPTISRAPNGRIDIVYYDLAVPSHLENTYLVSSTDSGRSFGAPRLLSSVPSDTDIRPAVGFGQGPNIGSQLVASEDETAYAAWTDSRRGGLENAKLDIFSTKVAFPGPRPPAGAAPPPPPAPFAGCSPRAAHVIRGTAARNTIVGTARADRIFAGAERDVVDGRAGDDCIDLGAGADRARGGTGADLMLGGTGADRVAGHSGGDRLRGLGGDDRLAGAGGRDRLSGGSGRDSISGGGSRDRISGGAGNDRVAARDRRRDRISCGSGRDRVVADRGDRVARDCERVRRPARR